MNTIHVVVLSKLKVKFRTAVSRGESELGDEVMLSLYSRTNWHDAHSVSRSSSSARAIVVHHSTLYIASYTTCRFA